MNVIETLGLFILLVYLPPLFIRPRSPQLRIRPEGFKKRPKLLLKLAKIEKGGNEDLDATEEKRFIKCYRKFENVSSAQLTFLYNQRLIHVQLPAINKSYFFPIDKHEKELIREKVGNLDDDIHVEFVLHRQKMGWFRSPILTGYIKKSKSGGIGFWENEEKDVEILFEFPEALATGGSPFAKRLENKYKLKKDVVVDFIPKPNDDLGYGRDIYLVDYKQEHENGGLFSFLLWP